MALCTALIVIAQLGPGPRTAALVVMGVLSMLIIIGVGLVLAVLWVPGMIASYLIWGWALLFFPSIVLHWRMMKGQAYA